MSFHNVWTKLAINIARACSEKVSFCESFFFFQFYDLQWSFYSFVTLCEWNGFIASPWSFALLQIQQLSAAVNLFVYKFNFASNENDKVKIRMRKKVEVSAKSSFKLIVNCSSWAEALNRKPQKERQGFLSRSTNNETLSFPALV